MIRLLIDKLDTQPELVPQTVQIRHRLAHTGRNEVEVRALDSSELVEVMPIPECAEWLKQLGFRWAMGTNGIWQRNAA